MKLCFRAGPEDEGKRLNIFLREQGVSATLIKEVKYHGEGFAVDGQPAHTDRRMKAGEQVAFALPPEHDTTVQPQAMPLCIRREDEHTLVLDKPAGIAVHPTLNYPCGTLANAWLGELQRRGEQGVFRPVNRIDKDTSGLVLCAKNAFAAPLLAAGVQKHYYTIVEGELPLGDGVVEAPIGRRGDSIIGRCVCENGKPSTTRYCVLDAASGYSLVRCIPVTGRTHQIRVHFSWLGHPLAGDSLYGGSRDKIGRHALHCGRMWFVPPLAGRTVQVDSPLPLDMSLLAEQAGLCLEKMKDS